MANKTYILTTNEFTGKQKIVTAHPSRGWERLNAERNTWGIKSARFISTGEAKRMIANGTPVK
jgi:hypothetical protein